MKKYLRLIGYEFKNIKNEPMNRFMLIYPLFAVLMFGVLIPLMPVDSSPGFSQDYYANFLLIVTVGLESFVVGSMLGMLILDDKEANTLSAVAVSPLGIKGYINFKAVFSILLSFVGSLIVFISLPIVAGDFYTSLNNLDNYYLSVTLLSFVYSVTGPVVGIFVGMVSKNKVQGMIVMKSLGLMVMLPALCLLDTFKGFMQYILGVFPNFWASKAFMNEILVINDINVMDNEANLSFIGYLVVGIIVSALVYGLLLKIFVRKQS